MAKQPVPLHRLTKAEIVWLSSHYCTTHRHTYLSHYNCYLAEQPNTERVGILDIESSNLKADYGIILTWCIKPLGKDEIIYDVISAEDIKVGRKGDEDRRVVTNLITEMREFDTVIGYYSKRFDLPFIRTRAVHMGVEFPFFGSIKHVDVYDMIRNRFNMSRKSQENACRVLLTETEKNHVDGRIWRDAARGDEDALGYVLDHNERDVRDLEKLYMKVKDYARKHEVSI